MNRSAQVMSAIQQQTNPATASIAAPAQRDDPFAVYIHIPFCKHICPYCDFNTYAGQESKIPQYVEALAREMALWSSDFGSRAAASVFLGGGTPSLLTPTQIRTLLDACDAAFSIPPEAEITIETNPDDLSVPYCEGLLEAGVNRISIGVQSLDRRGLRTLGRRHEQHQIGAAVAAARAAGFANLSLDMIFGWPGQSLSGWRNELQAVLGGEIGGEPPDHLSLYNLIVEPGTPMADAVKRGILVPVSDDETAGFFESAMEFLAGAGWIHYEIANWAATSAHHSRHNAVYWRNGEYAGIGAGAHGHVAGKRSMNHLGPDRYMSSLQASMKPVSNVEVIDDRTAMAETMMLGLRLIQTGVSEAAFVRRHGVELRARYVQQIERFVSLGLLEWDGYNLRLTARGVMLANSVCSEFLPS